jgi:hypothetical protein
VLAARSGRHPKKPCSKPPFNATVSRDLLPIIMSYFVLEYLTDAPPRFNPASLLAPRVLLTHPSLLLPQRLEAARGRKVILTRPCIFYMENP